jgi:hypothetical protein
MEVDERQRLHLVELLREVLDDQAAETLMAYLPPGGWADVATKSDLAVVKAELRAEIVELRGELRTEVANLRAAMSSQTRSLFFALAGLLAAYTAAIRLH